MKYIIIFVVLLGIALTLVSSQLDGTKKASDIAKNDYVVIKGRPSKVVEKSQSKPRKHGGSKVHLVAIDMFTGKKLEYIGPATDDIDIPLVEKKEYKVLSLNDDGTVSLEDLETSDKRDDINLPEGDIGRSIKSDIEANKDIIVTVVSAMSEEAIISYKIQD